MPNRIQRSRAKGWRMPEGAIYVGRTAGHSTWANPFVIGGYFRLGGGFGSFRLSWMQSMVTPPDPGYTRHPVYKNRRSGQLSYASENELLRAGRYSGKATLKTLPVISGTYPPAIVAACLHPTPPQPEHHNRNAAS